MAEDGGEAIRTVRDRVTPYTTLDGSEIRELMHPEVHGNCNQSLAEAVIHVGCTTRLHKHLHSEELYYIMSGVGRMTLDGQHFAVAAGDTICIGPRLAHQLENTGKQDLVVLCCCAPPYAHAETELL
jgi:mannose-6-phosphate isomerase-like protein (cupin superfamily)